MLESRYNVVLNKGGQQIGEIEKTEMSSASFLSVSVFTKKVNYY